ncbi:MAG: amidohydrolase family protein [Acidobacteria bacterium]|nr:amidohydrolase family protein [Acidobacteriota bacterium]
MRSAQRKFFFWGLLAFTVLPVSGQGVSIEDVPPEVLAYPDLILFEGKILTVDANFSTAEALAIRDGKILAIGNNTRILKMAGPRTEKINLRSNTVLPGFIDTHFHLGDYALRYMLLTERGVEWEGPVESMGLVWKNTQEALRDIQRAVKSANRGDLVTLVVYMSSKTLHELKREELDRISPENPVIVYAHAQLRPLASNTRAVEQAGIAPGRAWSAIDGVLISEQAAPSFRLKVSVEKMVEWQEKALRLANSWGLVQVTTRITPEQFNAVRELWLGGGLTVRWRLSFPGPVDIPRTGNLSDIGDDWLRISGAPVGAVPGSGHTLGHWTSKPALSPSQVTGEEGTSLSRWPEIHAQLLEALRYGWSIPNTHVVGDIAVSQFLDAIEEARQTPVVKSSNQRLTMDHMVELDPADIERIRRLGVVPSNVMRDLFDAGHETGALDYQAVFGADYLNRMLPLKEYLDKGVQATLEADTPDVNKGRPLWTIEKAVCRCVDGLQRVWAPGQRLTREQALRMKTIWAAAYTGDQDRQGSLEPGKLADLTVLDGDYLGVPEDRISELNVVLTIVGGKVVYRQN